MAQMDTVVARTRSVARVGRLLEILIAVKLIVAALAAYWMLRELVVLVRIRATGGGSDAPEIRAVVAAGRFIWVVNTPLLFATILVWLIWQFFSHDLIARTAPSRLRFGRWSSVGWWFVPFANVVMPFRVMRELWDATTSSDARTDARALLRWWVPWDAQVVLLYVMLFAGASEPSIDRSIVLHVLAIGSEALFVLCILPAITVVRTLTARATAMVIETPAVGSVSIPIRPDRDGEAVI